MAPSGGGACSRAAADGPGHFLDRLGSRTAGQPTEPGVTRRNGLCTVWSFVVASGLEMPFSGK